MKNFSAILFDLDNTLYDRDAAFQHWCKHFVHQHLPNTDTTSAILHMQELDEHGMTPREQFFTHLQHIYPSLNLSIPQMVRMFRSEFYQFAVPDPAMHPLFKALKTQNIPVGVVTNGSTTNQTRKIAQLEIPQYTSCIFISEQYGIKKPAASIFLAAANHLDIPPEHILFVGDHPRLDVWGAHHVGMQTVWLQRLHQPWPTKLNCTPDLIITTLAELLPAS